MCQSGATHLPMDWNNVNVSEWSDTFNMDWNKVNVSEWIDTFTYGLE
jgi:hypothetical protein